MLRLKALILLGVGDFQHPLRRKEIDEKLSEDENGILRTASGFPFFVADRDKLNVFSG